MAVAACVQTSGLSTDIRSGMRLSEIFLLRPDHFCPWLQQLARKLDWVMTQPRLADPTGCEA
jgi:hypothetical protein